MNRLFQRSNLSQAFQRYQSLGRRYSTQNGGGAAKVPKVEPTPGKPPGAPVPPETKKKSGGYGGIILFIGLVDAGLYYLALKVKEEDPTAIHIAEQPVINLLVTPFLNIVSGPQVKPPVRIEKDIPRIPEIVVPPQEPKVEAVPVEETPAATTHEEVVAADDKDSHNTATEAEQNAPSSENTHVSVEFTEEEVDEILNADIEKAISAHSHDEDHHHSHHTEAPSSDDHHSHHNEVKAEECTECDHSGHHHHHQPHHHATETHQPSGNLPLTSAGEVITAQTQTHAEQIFHSGRTSQETVSEVLTNVSRNSIALRKELESVLLRDIHTLDADALRIRITQLVGEFFERLSWESIRISQNVIQVEKELNEKYDKLLQHQRKELELQINTILFNKEKEIQEIITLKENELNVKYQNDLSNQLKSQAEGFHNTLKTELNKQANEINQQLLEQFNNHLANLQLQYSNSVTEILGQVSDVNAQVTAYEAVLDTTQTYLKDSQKAHQLSSAILGLELLLTHSIHKANVVEEKLTALKQLSNNDELIASIIQSIPRRVQEKGVLTLPELQVRFKILHNEVREVALAPEGAPSVISQAIGKVLAQISIAPVGYVSGEGVEETMARAAYLLEKGQLKACLEELERVQGYSKVLLQDWKTLATDRLVVDQAVQALKADSLIRHRSFR